MADAQLAKYLTAMALTFELDARKAAANLAKHGVSFDEAVTAFADPLGRLEDDDRHSVSETRLVLLPTRMKRPVSKKPSRARRVPDDDIRPEYDFSKGRPNPYATQFQGAVTVVTLDSDVAETFPDAAAVNDALRALAKIANRPTKKV